MSKDSKTIETVGFALFPAFIIYNQIYDPNISQSGFLFLAVIVTILLWLYSMGMWMSSVFGGSETDDPYYALLAILNIFGVLAVIAFTVLRAIFRMLG